MSAANLRKFGLIFLFLEFDLKINQHIFNKELRIKNIA